MGITVHTWKCNDGVVIHHNSGFSGDVVFVQGEHEMVVNGDVLKAILVSELRGKVIAWAEGFDFAGLLADSLDG